MCGQTGTVATANRDGLDRLIAELVAGPDTCEGRYTGNGSTGDCGEPATRIVYIDGGRGDWLDTFCPACGTDSYAAKGVFATWDGSRWVKAAGLPSWTQPDATPPAAPPRPYPHRHRP